MITSAARLVARVAILAALVAALLAAFADGAAAENQNPYDAGVGQMALCESMGGEASYGENRTVASGVIETIVICTGGYLGGVTCQNHPEGTYCVSLPRAGDGRGGRVVRAEVVEVAPVVGEPAAKGPGSGAVPTVDVAPVDGGMAPLEDEG